MTLDEVINCYKVFDGTLILVGDESKQIAEWLEELKCYKNDNDFSDYADRLYKIAFNSGYNKAIDNFTKILTSDELLNYDIAFVLETSSYGTESECTDMFVEYVNKIAEKLKVGGANDD